MINKFALENKSIRNRPSFIVLARFFMGGSQIVFLNNTPLIFKRFEIATFKHQALSHAEYCGIINFRWVQKFVKMQFTEIRRVSNSCKFHF